MDENLSEQELLLVVEKDSNELKAVTGLKEDGTPKTVKPEMKNEPEFLKIDKHGDVLENFFANFLRQAKEPTHFHFFKVPLDKMENMVMGMKEMLKNPENPTNKKMLDEQRVLPENFAPMKYKAIDESRIDWKVFESIGVTREQLVKTGSLDKMLNWQKSPVLFPVEGEAGGINIMTDARLSFRETPEGEIALRIHSVRQQPELDQPLYGTILTEEDKKNLLETGNAGRLIEFKVGEDKTINGFVSIDKLTNELVVLNAEKLRVPDELKGVKLSEQQKLDISQGKAVFIENMISKKQTPFSAAVQVNADKRGLEFSFPDTQKQAEALTVKIKNGEAPGSFRKVKLSEDQKNSLKDGYTVFVSGIKDKNSRKYSGFITLNKQQGKIDFMFPNKYKEALKSGLVIPDRRHKLQVSANNEGTKTEATIKVDEPLKKGQTQPTEKQSDNISKDKEKLQSIARFGYEGVKEHPNEHNFADSFLNKYNLKSNYNYAHEAYRDSVIAETVEEHDSCLNQCKTFSDKMKATAVQELAKLEQKDSKIINVSSSNVNTGANIKSGETEKNVSDQTKQGQSRTAENTQEKQSKQDKKQDNAQSQRVPAKRGRKV